MDSNLDLACITETWFKDTVNDNAIHIPGYKLVRKDRTFTSHGGVCIYIREEFQCFRLNAFESDNAEVLYIKIRPRRLPQGIPCIVVKTIYHPPSNNNSSMIDYLVNSLSAIESEISNCGIILAGDLNHLDTTSIKRQFRLKQLVDFPTRGRNTLDVILTNMPTFYEKPVKSSPFGLSDHCTITISPISKTKGDNKPVKIVSRDLRPSKKDQLGRYLSSIDWTILASIDLVEDKAKLLEDYVTIGLDNIMPIRTITVHSKDAPWMTCELKSQIRKRQLALQQGNDTLFRYYRTLLIAIERSVGGIITQVK